jgi:hypothetical protein
MIINFVHSALLDYTALFHNQNTVTDRIYYIEVMANEKIAKIKFFFE